jgi:hypothetical protein
MTVLLVVAGAVAAVLVPLSLHERQVVHDATIFGAFTAGADVQDAVDAVNGVAGLYFLVFLSIAVLWMIWMWRAAANTALLRRFKPRFANGFAIGGWFIPIAFWIIPGMHMYDIDRGSGPPARPGERPRGSGLLVLWWVLFVASWAGSGFGQVTLQRGHRYDTSSFDVRNVGFIVAMLAAVAAAVLAIVVVRSITRAQHEAWEAMVGGAQQPYVTAALPDASSAPAPASTAPPAPVPPPVVVPPPPPPSPRAWPGPPADAPSPDSPVDGPPGSDA